MQLAQLNANLLVMGISSIVIGSIVIFVMRKIEYYKTTKEYEKEINSL